MRDISEMVRPVRDFIRDRIEICRWWLRDVGRPYPSIEWVRFIAFAEWNRNPTITTYTFEDGVEHRRFGSPIARITAAVDKWAMQATKAFAQMQRSFAELGREVRK